MQVRVYVSEMTGMYSSLMILEIRMNACMYAYIMPKQVVYGHSNWFTLHKDRSSLSKKCARMYVCMYICMFVCFYLSKQVISKYSLFCSNESFSNLTYISLIISDRVQPILVLDLSAFPVGQSLSQSLEAIHMAGHLTYEQLFVEMTT